MRLPELFLERMKELLGEEYELWLESCGQMPVQGIRVNPAKLAPGQWEQISPWEIRRVPWNLNGYYCQEKSRPARDVYYYAGLYYIQEPSAMAPAELLGVKPGQKVLDLCAAPGGKSTQLGARLEGRGLLVANDVSASRAKALLKNLEMAGVANICVTAEEPKRLAQVFSGFFDKILVDAPCSGEGMFRKEPELIKSWQERGPKEYVPVQREILKQAVRMLRPGGELVYSTCTFSVEEDEGAVDWILAEEPDMELVPLALWEGARPGADKKPVIRLFPHRIRGEGHFVAKLKKRQREDGGSEGGKAPGEGVCRKDEKELELLEQSDYLEWERFLARPFDRHRLTVQFGQVYFLPEDFRRDWGFRYLRTGLLVGSLRRGRFEPSQAAAMALKSGEFARALSMDREDERVIRYLKGETVFLKEGEDFSKGWVLVCVDGFPLGWAKAAGGSLKNKYYPGWRWM